jgi:hypothetical protein
MTVKEILVKQRLEQEVKKWERVIANTANPAPLLYQLKRAQKRLKSFLISVDSPA